MVMLDKEIFGLDMFGTFGAGCMTILLEGESTHVVLENDIFINNSLELRGNGESTKYLLICHKPQQVLFLSSSWY